MRVASTKAAEEVLDVEAEMEVGSELVLDEVAAIVDEECPGPSRLKVQAVR